MAVCLQAVWHEQLPPRQCHDDLVLDELQVRVGLPLDAFREHGRTTSSAFTFAGAEWRLLYRHEDEAPAGTAGASCELALQLVSDLRPSLQRLPLCLLAAYYLQDPALSATPAHKGRLPIQSHIYTHTHTQSRARFQPALVGWNPPALAPVQCGARW
jgi:hypothetical protein